MYFMDCESLETTFGVAVSQSEKWPFSKPFGREDRGVYLVTVGGYPGDVVRSVDQ